jgi:hypothetical protein
MWLIDQVIDFLVSNKEAILVGASAVVVLDFAVRALKSGTSIATSVLGFILNLLWIVLIKPLLLGLGWLFMKIVDMIIFTKEYVNDRRKNSLKDEQSQS